MRLFPSAFGHRTLAVFVLLAGVSLMSSSCKILGVPPTTTIQCPPGSKTFTVAGNGTSLNEFRIPAGCTRLEVDVWAAGGGGGGGHATRANRTIIGYGGGGGASGDCYWKQFAIVSGIATTQSTIAENTLLTINVGAGGPGGAGQPAAAVNSRYAPSGGNGAATKVLASGTVNPLLSVPGANAGGGGDSLLPGGKGGERGEGCSYSGSDTFGIGGGRGGTSVSGISDFVFGDGGAGGEDPGCNEQGRGGSGGAAPGGGGGGGSGGRTCGVFGGRHSGGSGGSGGDGQVAMYWR